jgi:ribose transport system ATP-binding protein
VDIAAKAEIAAAIVDAAASGVAVLLCSSDAKELAQLCHRVLVLDEGRIVGEVVGEEISEAALIRTGHITIPEDDGGPAGPRRNAHD